MISPDKPICLLLGGNKLNAGIADRFHEWGCDVVVVDWNEAPAVQGGLHLRLDVKMPGPILAALRERGYLDRITFGFTSIDVAVPSLATVLKACGMQVNSEEGLANAFSKSRQTEIWARAGLLNRRSEKVDGFGRLQELADWNRVQSLIVKPDNAASSRGITIVEKGSAVEALRMAIAKALENASNGLSVVEEFVVGTEFTVEMMGDGEGHVAVYAISKKQHTVNTDSNKIAVKLHYNAISEDLQRKIADVGVKCYRALGFKNSLGHLEVLLKEDGTVSPVEIGARSSGYIASHLVDIASGRSYLGDLRDVYHGGTIPDGLRPQSPNSSMYFFYDIPGGSTITHACSLLDFCDKAIKSWATDISGLYVGRRVEKIDNDNARLGMEVLEGPRDLMTEPYIADAERRFLKRLLAPVDAADEPTGGLVPGRVRELKYPMFGDVRGQLIALEDESEGVPFELKRVYYIFGTAAGMVRGNHAHRTLRQVLVCTSGACTIECEFSDGTVEEHRLDWPDKALLVEGLVWRRMKDFSRDAVLMVLADQHYDESDYVRSYEDFKRLGASK